MNLGGPELLILLVLGAVAALVVIAVTSASNPTVPTAPVTPPPPVTVEESADLVVARIVQLLVQNGALVTAQTSTSVTGHVVTKKKPSVLVAILLWFICVVPMVIYLINSSKDVQEPFSISLTPVPGGTRVEGGGTGRGMSAVHWVLSQLGGSLAASVSAVAATTLPTSDESGALPPAPAPRPATPEGWYADPQGGTGLRWWDGTRWTDHVSGD